MQFAMIELQKIADVQGVPGPNVEEHPEGYDGPCYCQTCLSYGDGTEEDYSN